jgi:hypothetical protein
MLYDWGTLRDVGPKKVARDLDLAAYLLTPGFSRSYHKQALRVSNATVWKYTAWARELAARDPRIFDMVAANVASISRDDAVLMAVLRGRCQLPFWSKLAICELLNERLEPREVANIFNCSPRTIQYARSQPSIAYNFLTADRQLSSSQLSPPARGRGFAQSRAR